MAEKIEEAIEYSEWLKDPRNTEVVDPVTVTDEYIIGPASYHSKHFPNWGVLKNAKEGEAFLLTERSFKGMINEAFRYLPSNIIERLIEEGRRPDVLDVGGGRDGFTARELAGEYPTARVTNIDMVARALEEGNYRSKPGDIMDLPAPDESFDLVYSHQVLPFLSKDEGFRRHRRVLSQIDRVLRPGGIAIIDDGGAFSSVGDSQRGFLHRELNADVFIGKKSYGGGFLVLAKPPAGNEIIQLTRKIAAAA